MSLIEKAARRLEELKRSGVAIHDADEGAAVAPAAPPAPDAQIAPAPDGSKRAFDVQQAAPAATPEPQVPPPGPARAAQRVGLDYDRLAAAGIVTPDAPRSQVADEFRVIKRPLITNALGRGAARVRNGNLIMVTSAFPGEGKTFCSINLAMSIAMELDTTVLLVDADVAKPSVLTTFGLPTKEGLLDVLSDPSIDLADVLLRTDVDRLSLLPSGTRHERATELLASEAMNRLLDEMAQRYADRVIVFDSPPLLVTTESRVLASHMGQVVLVVEAERTSHADVKQALATVDACPVKLLMLNKGSAASAGGYYGYHGSGRGYGYGYGT
jgi:receptor protein-tyrosine kinase